MQLITLTIAALSIGTHVLAAPTPAKRAISCVNTGDLTCLTKRSLPVVESIVPGGLETLPSDVLTTVGPLTAPVADVVGGVAGTAGSVVEIATDIVHRGLDSITGSLDALVGNKLTDDTVENTLESAPVVGKTVDSILRRSISSLIATSKANNDAASLVASHVSPIIKRSTVSTVTSAVSELVSRVTAELGVISTTIDTLSAVSVPGLTDTPLLTVSVAPTVAKALDIIASTLDATVAKVLPVLTTTVEPLVDTEIAAIGGVLGDVNDLLINIETVVLSLLKTVTAEVKPLVVTEVQAVLKAVTPLVAPITTFAFAITGDVSSTAAQVTEVRSAAGTVFATVSGLTSPAGSVMRAL